MYVDQIVTLAGKQYNARTTRYPLAVLVANNLATIDPTPFNLGGYAKFMLTSVALTTVTGTGTQVTDRRFLWRMGASDTGIQFSYSGLGLNNDWVIDTNFFGTGQFPAVFDCPYIFEPNTSIVWQIRDLSNNAPYTAHIVFNGCYLLPV